MTAPLHPIAALFCRRDSVYKGMPAVDAWDADRDARRYPGNTAVVAHPPCRGWGRMRQFASKVRPDEKALALFAVRVVRSCGGVLEHPAKSTLWAAAGLPEPGAGRDAWGGYSIEVRQFDFGHRAEKLTWLYLCPSPWAAYKGTAEPPPAIETRPGEPTHVIRCTHAYPRLPSVTKAEREHTPPEFARWLVEAARCMAGHGTGWRMTPQGHPGPRRWNQDPALTGDAHRLLKRDIQKRIAQATKERLRVQAFMLAA